MIEGKAKEIMEKINLRFDRLFHETAPGIYEPHVCIICDEFLKPDGIEVLTLAMLKENRVMLTASNQMCNVSPDLASCYRYTGMLGESSNEDFQWVQDLLLSPRACYLRPQEQRRKEGLSVCRSCKQSLQARRMPKFAIANNYCFGTPPLCLLELTEVELSMLTPVKTYGYCFSYTGGFQKQLKGSLSYYKVRMESIARAVSHFEVLGLNNDVVVLLYGKMTPEQNRKAREKNKIRTQKLLVAIEWLIMNNEEWRSRQIDFNHIQQSLRNPTLIDNSKTLEERTVSETDNNIESTESFEVFFPDGTMSPATGGQSDVQQFKDLIQASQKNGFNLEFRCNLYKEAVADFKDNNLVNACLIQFPYGRGGMHEQRLRANGSFTSNTDITEYVEHISRISQPHFHTELFTLILYNLTMKQQMVKSAGWKVRNKADASLLAKELTETDVTAAISARQNGTQSENSTPGRSLLNAVDAVARAVPHTNEAAKRARRDGEAFQHHFGMASWFISVTPDDENSVIVQIYSGRKIDLDDRPIQSLSNEELSLRAKERTKLRIKYPGITAHFFELVLDIIIREVVGWNLEEQQPTRDSGLFGIPEALVAAVEEQGRKTLHVHLQVWIKEFSRWRDSLYSHQRHERRLAENHVKQAVDRVSSCKLFSRKRCRNNAGNLTAFPHHCTVPLHQRQPPTVVDDQDLRYLRYKRGVTTSGEVFATCPHCTMSWTSEELLESYLIYGIKVPGLTDFPDRNSKRLKAMAVEHQKTGDPIDPTVIDATYNHHGHTSASCFGKAANLQESGKSPANSGRKKKSDLTECRYRLPQRKKRRTVVQDVEDQCIKWYSWDGSFEERQLKEVCVRRHQYDGFQNVSCPAISQSRLTCNTNVSPVMPGPVGQYMFKYGLKQTQEDELAEYERVAEATRKVLSKAQTHESERSEAVRRLLVASFAHQKTNVVGASMASYLTRNKSRFIMSHKTVWCPLRDIEALLKGGEASVSILHHGKKPFFQCAALHYLCRPVELEHLNAFDFYSDCEVIRQTSNNEGELLDFSNAEFVHPSYRARDNRFVQGVRLRHRKHLIKVFQYDFPDTAEFGGSILDENCLINSPMETYCKLVLMLFLPYRNLDDIMHGGSYTRRLRRAVSEGDIGETATYFLQNLQDARANCFRSSGMKDDLQRNTDPFANAESAAANVSDELDEDEEDERGALDGAKLDELLQLFEDDRECESPATLSNDLPESFSLNAVRQKGVLKCGYESLANMNMATDTTEPVFEVQQSDDIGNAEVPEVNDDSFSNVNQSPSRKDLIKILMSKTSRRRRTFEEITKSKREVDVLEANGSVRSIIDWAKKARLDRRQRRAFEIIAGSFVLTFFTEASQDDSFGRGFRSRFQSFFSEKIRLERLVEQNKRGDSQLICLLHGPGGSGKTTVIDLVVEYAREYCDYMEDFQFTSRTIVVTAMTGVAATILLGETTHSAVYLNQKKPLEAEQIECWSETRLLIIDEISFADKGDFVKLHQNLRRLKQCLHRPYGGLNIIFAGDLRQLEPVGQNKKPVYSEDCPQFKDWVNSFIELCGMHRFKDDIEWGRLLFRFRDGEVSEADIDTINECVVDCDCPLPDDIRYATYFNRDRDAINAALFEERCTKIYRETGNTNDTIIIFADELKVRNGSKTFVPFQNCRAFWESCAEDDVRTPRTLGRMDPVLKLYRGCRVMLPCNKDVKSGQANGTQAIVEKVVLKSGVTPHEVKLNDAIPVTAVQASNVSHIVLRHLNDRVRPEVFSIEPKKYTFKAKVLKPRVLQVKNQDREVLCMKGIQLPILVNNATTGHKLQGSGVDKLFVHNWSYVTNWVYVMLSRVKTRAGLFSRVRLN